MVARRKPYAQILYMIILFITILSLAPVPVRAQSIRYHLEHQYTVIWVNDDGSIDLLYDVEIACDSERITRVWIGQPNRDFTLGEAFDEDGNLLEIHSDFEEDPSVRVLFHTPISAGESLRFNLTTNVQKMVWLDEDNPGNVGVQFIPTWWGETVEELRVIIVLPEGAVQEDVRNTPDWDNIFSDEETGRLVLYWERADLQPNQKFTVGVSFPEELVSQYETQRSGWEKFLSGFILLALPIIIILIILAAIVRVIRKALKKRPYSKPRMRMETLGAKRGLTAVEAAWLLGLGPVRVVVAMLYSLLRKRAIWVKEREPKLMLEVQPEFRDGTGTRENPLRYYEHLFIHAIGKDGTLNEDGLASAVRLVRDTVEQKMRGYNRRDTLQHYRKIVDKAWSQVEGAGTPELMSEAFDEELLWLYIDDDFEGKIKTTMENQVFVPSNNMWWYWWWARPRPEPPTPKPAGVPSTIPSTPQPLPGAEFADRIVTTLEESANKLVTNVENFADAIAPSPPQPVKRAPVRRGSGGTCACASCACACACVSCACACAGGRVG